MNAATEAPKVPLPRTFTSRTPARLVVLVGNPNVGKTALFNGLTGQNARVGNYAGVTVERRSGVVRGAGEKPFELLDVPGTYSLAARSAEEQIAIAAVLGMLGNEAPSLCVVVVDAGQLARNLYLVLQLIELRVPLVVAVNMIDEVAENPPNVAALERILGVACVATNARSGQGLDKLTGVIRSALAKPTSGRLEIQYPSTLLHDVDRVAEALPDDFPKDVERRRALSLWALSSIEPDDELEGISEALRARCADVRRAAGDRDLDHEIIASRYARIDAMLPELFGRVDPHPPKRKASERVDRVLLHPVAGFVVFLATMLLVFQALFSWSEPLVTGIESLIGFFGTTVRDVVPEGWFRDLLADGVIGGVGNVIVFLPQILLLFLFIGVLEDSGYMARVAYLMDRVMKSLGLHGRAFVPMLSGFACAVPAILATRTMERKRDRLLTMLVIPLMTCSARLPVYSLIIGTLFPARAPLLGFISVQSALLVFMYAFSMVTTLAAAGILGKTVVRGRRIPLLLELPPYRLPGVGNTLRLMLERARVFLKEAGTLILVCTILLWALLAFPRISPESSGGDTSVGISVTPTPGTSRVADTALPKPHALKAESPVEATYGGRLGKAIEPLIAPLGFDWQLGIGIIGAFAAREVFVSTMGLVYGLGDMDDEAVPLRERMRSERTKTGEPRYTALVGLSLMIFFALSCQCMSTLAVVRRETQSLAWPAFMFGYMTVLAYFASFVVYQGGKLLGF